MARFDYDLRQWKTVEEFTAHLARHDPAIAPWAKGTTIHHTYVPRIDQWRGATSMEGTKNYYIGLGWTAGPHLFIAHGSPDPAHDGIWQMTPLNLRGIHAGVCNSDYWGIEMVGDYDQAPWSAGLRALVVGATAALLQWRGLSVSAQTINGHRNCNSPKTCPGSKMDLNDIRTWISRAMSEPQTIPTTEYSPLIAAPRATQAQATAWLLDQPHPNYTRPDIAIKIIPAYYDIAPRVGIDPAEFIAQIDVEGAMASFWGARPQRNPAGIGVDGSYTTDEETGKKLGYVYSDQRKRWEKGISFESWADYGTAVTAVEAHIGRMLAYALLPQECNAEQSRLIARALSVRPLPAHARGSARILRHLGVAHNPANVGRPKNERVGWADPGTDYGAKIAARIERMRQY